MSYNIKVCNSLFDTKNKFGWLIGWFEINTISIITIYSDKFRLFRLLPGPLTNLNQFKTIHIIHIKS